MNLSTLVFIILVIALVGGLPTWNYSRSWGYGPSGGILGLIVILTVLYLLGVIRVRGG